MREKFKNKIKESQVECIKIGFEIFLFVQEIWYHWQGSSWTALVLRWFLGISRGIIHMQANFPHVRTLVNHTMLSWHFKIMIRGYSFQFQNNRWDRNRNFSQTISHDFNTQSRHWVSPAWYNSFLYHYQSKITANLCSRLNCFLYGNNIILFAFLLFASQSTLSNNYFISERAIVIAVKMIQ